MLWRVVADVLLAVVVPVAPFADVVPVVPVVPVVDVVVPVDVVLPELLIPGHEAAYAAPLPPAMTATVAATANACRPSLM